MAMDIQSGNRNDEERRVRTFQSCSFAYPYVEPPSCFCCQLQQPFLRQKPNCKSFFCYCSYIHIFNQSLLHVMIPDSYFTNCNKTRTSIFKNDK